MANRPTDGPELRFIDRPDLGETFADSMQGFAWDGNTLRIVFSVTRLDQPMAGAMPTAQQYPTCRLVLSQAGALELLEGLSQLRNQLVEPEGSAPALPSRRPN